MLISVVRPIPPQCLAFVREHEGCRLVGYLDSAAVPTVGVGHTGPEVRVGQTITQAQADAYLEQDLHAAAEKLEQAVGEDCIRELTDNQYSALVSWAFNVGVDPRWTVCQRLRAKQFDAVPAELMRFVWAGGHKLNGLVSRRADEVKLFCTGEPGAVDAQPPSSVTRIVPTPPTPATVKPLDRSKSFIGSCVAAVCTTGAAGAQQIKDAADKASDIITPYVGHSTVLEAATHHLALVAALAALAVPALLWLKQREARQA